MNFKRTILTIAFVAAASQAWGQAAPAPAIEPILANPKVAKTLEDIKADDARTLDEQKRITEIPAPPFKEKIRAEYYQKRMQELGFKDAAIDSEGNVIALRKGSGGGRPKLVVSAHLDTVFPEGTDVTVKEKDGAFVAPGIGDDSRGLAALLSLIKAMNANEIATVGDIMFVGTVGEEELGNLRGVKALFRDHKDIDGFISIDGLGITRVVNHATGSHRYEFIFKGPGGHSFQEFGLPSAIHAMGRAIAKISELQPPSDPKTTFTVGTVVGGTSVNAIAAEARMAVDMRSNSTDELLKLEARLLDLVKEAVADENARWKSDKLGVEARMIGDRPAGIVPMDSPIVQATQRAVAAVTRAPRVTFAGSSTDSNIAMSLGIPAVTIGGGGEGGNWHSRNEWYKPTDAYFGPQNALLTVLMLTGLDGVTKPALVVRQGK
ncbi:M20/M25/M40 family metallo-hydrolase [Bradyrhizobium sp. AUGA SZCCT0169]|uniref:M20/M25/M40 family metallo-hydrolase n=1 Tax=Bradyrhizobium sp. AUGA SZCCT0169 TaxID=2807663 RepID=UPI001BAB236C|nr:M20/M25/M40 family metallo-hydrolase [Bradyrhizobium sp. AUGA SZCCT0169]MBR1245481.1 M20/M25/M40 family metallo-hydrolase [Bradyrhizobium sp. AUGA SZCCT0169]